jgi:hypothetical protein
MVDSGPQLSRVQLELLELKQRGQVKTQADKFKECTLFANMVRLGFSK